MLLFGFQAEHFLHNPTELVNTFRMPLCCSTSYLKYLLNEYKLLLLAFMAIRNMMKHFHLSMDTFMVSIVFCTVFMVVNSLTLPSDIEVLRSFKESIDPNSISSTSFLNTWNLDTDPCETIDTHFLGILCTIPQDNSSKSRISAIDLEGDGLEGFLTPTIGSLTELTELNLKRNTFRGPIPLTITNLRMLSLLQLANNFLSGGIPPGLSNLNLLKSIDLSQNTLSGKIPKSLSALRGLTHLSLAGNELSGEIPDFSALRKLKSLDLSGNQLHGSLPTLPTNLQTLLLSHNMIYGHLTPIKKLMNLKTFDISDNRMSDTIIPEILMFPEINYINVSANLFTSINVIKATDQPSLLQVLDAHNNRLHGRLPVNLITYANLTSIYLGSNLFSDRIPAEYGGKLHNSSWARLFLDHNYLEGNLPPEFVNYGTGIRGSVAHNCLHCPMNVKFCQGGQRPASECIRQNGGN